MMLMTQDDKNIVLFLLASPVYRTQWEFKTFCSSPCTAEWRNLPPSRQSKEMIKINIPQCKKRTYNRVYCHTLYYWATTVLIYFCVVHIY